MSTCFDEGQLRAYLDGELAPAELAAVGKHAVGCPGCGAALAALRARTARLSALLPAGPPPNPRAALGRARAAARVSLPAGASQAPATERSIHMPLTSFLRGGRLRALAAAAVAVIAVLSLLALPPVRAAADSLLSVFRVQKIVFVPIDRGRISQLESLNIDGGALFVGKPEFTNRTPPRTVASAGEATAATGRAVSEPAALPGAPTSTEFTVNSGGRANFRVNPAAVRQVLEALDIRDVSIPDALGAAPITVDMPAYTTTRYHGAGYDLTLHQSPSPNVTLPDGVELPQLGRAALRVLGMSPEQAELAAGQINWNNTLVFPFPTDANNIRQVTVNGDSGLIVVGGPRGSQHGQIYWQHGDTIYMLEGRSDAAGRDQELADLLLRTAESVR